jgi:hypothetical protein
MPPWLLIWIFRFGRGERFRKATPGERRYFAGYFLLVAMVFIVVELSNHLSHSFTTFIFDNATPLNLWLGFTLLMSVFFFGAVFWARYVSARISSILAVIAWVLLLGMVFYFEWL